MATSQCSPDSACTADILSAKSGDELHYTGVLAVSLLANRPANLALRVALQHLCKSHLGWRNKSAVVSAGPIDRR